MSGILNALGFGRQRQRDYFRRPDTSHYHYKTQFAMLGTIGSGKSAVAAGIVLSAQTKSSDEPGFTCRVLEGNSKIDNDVSRLRQGRFPEKTPAHMPVPYESGLLITYAGFLNRKKQVQIPLGDIAGEDVIRVVPRVHALNPLETSSYNANVALLQHVRDAQGYICVLPASRVLLFPENVQLESVVPKHSAEHLGLVADPDVNLKRILSAIFTHKEVSHGKKIKGIAVVVTKWDLLAPYAENLGVDIYEPTGVGLRNFMDVAFPATSMELKAWGLHNIEFFPSYFKVKRDDQGTPVKWPNGGDRIEVVRKRPDRPTRIPNYSETSYMRMFDWLEGLAT